MAHHPHRFHLVHPPDQGMAVLAGEEFHHLRHVLRLAPGMTVVLFDGLGGEYEGRLRQIGKADAQVEIVREWRVPPRPVDVVLAWALCKSRAAEILLQKGTELGVASFLPFMAARSGMALSGEKGSSARARWAKIVIQAAKQCGSAFVPPVAEPTDFQSLLARAASWGLRIIPHPQSSQPLRDVLRQRGKGTVGIAVGPEGGFTDEEIVLAVAAGFQPVAMGPSILRSETAALAVLAAVNYELVW